jgi:hypothetical protein
MMADIIDYSKGGLFYSNINTKNMYPLLSNDFNEKTIYLAFIYFCKFKSLIPMPQDLIPICTDKPDITLINPTDFVLDLCLIQPSYQSIISNKNLQSLG